MIVGPCKTLCKRALPHGCWRVRSALLSSVARFVWVSVFPLPFDIRLCPRLRLRPLCDRFRLRQLRAHRSDRPRLRPLGVSRLWHFVNPLTYVLTAATPSVRPSSLPSQFTCNFFGNPYLLAGLVGILQVGIATKLLDSFILYLRSLRIRHLTDLL